MKTREQILQEVKNLNKKHLLLALPTGLGKSALALHLTFDSRKPQKVLIVYPQVVLKNNWIDEIKKWGYEDYLESCIEFTTYKSLEKYAGIAWDTVIFDEGHHITERVLEIISLMTINHAYVLSATVKSMVRNKLMIAFPGMCMYKMGMKEAINSDILPDPTIILMPLVLDTINKTESIIKNPKATKSLTIEFDKRNYYFDKTTRYVIPCTEHQYGLYLDEDVERWKKKAMSSGSQAHKNLWLHAAGVRLKWLASKKTAFVKVLLKILKKERTLTFCGNIKQTEDLGKHCIHSKNSKSGLTLKDFNDGVINHITAVAMLDEGQNLTNCRIGIFANINSSDRLQIQRTGRILRHDKPIIIIPYFKGSREDEIVSRMIEGYNPELIKVVTNVKYLTHEIA